MVHTPVDGPGEKRIGIGSITDTVWLRPYIVELADASLVPSFPFFFFVVFIFIFFVFFGFRHWDWDEHLGQGGTAVHRITPSVCDVISPVANELPPMGVILRSGDQEWPHSLPAHCMIESILRLCSVGRVGVTVAVQSDLWSIRVVGHGCLE